MAMHPLRYGTRHPAMRRGVAAVEGAIVLGVVFVFLFSALELGLLIVRNTSIAEAAHRIGRLAIVNGSPPASGTPGWGPATLEINADTSHPIAQCARDVLVSMNPADVAITLRWPDKTNHVDDRVQVTVTYVHEPLLALPGYSSFTLLASTVMRIAH